MQLCINKVMYYVTEDVMEAHILCHASCHLGSHASGQLIHER